MLPNCRRKRLYQFYYYYYRKGYYFKALPTDAQKATLICISSTINEVELFSGQLSISSQFCKEIILSFPFQLRYSFGSS